MISARKALERLRRLYEMPKRLDAIHESIGRVEARLNRRRIESELQAFEFKVYSQWGEDGILEHLTSVVDIPNRAFVEFGVENYTEANTLFLLKHRGWRGLVIDGSTRNIESIRSGDVLWRYDLHARCAFVTRENVDSLLAGSGFVGDIGLLSVDIDGNDYWVWEAIACVKPRLVVIEYNSLFGRSATVAIPYDAGFRRSDAHPSNMYYGASLGALGYLARQRGYGLVGSNSAGNNAFFVRTDCLGSLRVLSPTEAYVQASFREARTTDGQVDLLTFKERRAAIGELPVVDVTNGRVFRVRDAL